MDDQTLHLDYKSITGPRAVEIVPVMQMGRMRYQILANDARLELAGSFFLTPRKAMEEVESTLRKRYGEMAGELKWVLKAGGVDRPVAAADVGDSWPG
ncbi:MAG: hypothetical protein HYY06_31690 [Deltaproteobacteria bacterium]|nr:hypothetical protein [Deltaproteobacteria bacterium]